MDEQRDKEMHFLSPSRSKNILEYKFYVTFVFEFPQEIRVRVEAVTNNVGKLESEPRNTLYIIPSVTIDYYTSWLRCLWLLTVSE